MKLKNILFLFEDRVEFITDKFGAKLVQKANDELHKTVQPSYVVGELTKADPSKNKQYLQWIVNQYLKGQFRLEDTSRIKNELEQFNSLKSRLPEKDINKYDYYKLSDTIDSLTNKVQLIDVPASLEGVKVLYDGPLGLLAIPETRDAACELGRGTKWCTAARENNMFSYYTKEGPLYVWKDKSGEKYQFHFETLQFMDDEDRPIHTNKLTEFRTKHPVLSKLFKQKEQTLIDNNDISKVYDYMREAVTGRWPEVEPLLKKSDPIYIINYCLHCLKERWPEIEEYTYLKHSMVQYAKSIIKTRDAKFEQKLIDTNNAHMVYGYIVEMIHGPWPEAESVILTNIHIMKHYITGCLTKRWPECEEILLNKDPNFFIRNYVIKIIQQRLPEYEAQLIKTAQPDSLGYYAHKVIKGRWPEAEEKIKQTSYTAYLYAEQIIKGRWPEGEAAILKDAQYTFYYTMFVLKSAWPEAEPILKERPVFWAEYKQKYKK